MADIKWVNFPDRTAQLVRFVLPTKKVTIGLAVSATGRGQKIALEAEKLGFNRKPSSNFLHWPVGKKMPYTVDRFAKVFGGEVIEVPEGSFREKPWTRRIEAKEPGINPESMERIGVNFRDEPVLRNSDGRFYRVVDDNGRPRYVQETAKDRPALFLHAATPQDIPLVAQGVLKQAAQESITAEMVERIVDLMIEAGPAGPINLSREEVARELKAEIVSNAGRQIRAAKDSREGYDAALRLGERLSQSGVFGFTEGGFIPPLALAVSLRRAIGATHGLFADAGARTDLARYIGLPLRGKDSQAPDGGARKMDLQVRDLTGVSPENRSEMILATLANRTGEGRTWVMLDGDPDDEANQILREEIGRRYGVETMARIDPVVASGRPDGRAICIFGIGAQRPEIAPMLPDAARRTFTVSTERDLWTWSSEALRSRGRIQEWIESKGEADLAKKATEDREANERQVPYRPLSLAKPPFTMIPMALEGATMKALRRVGRDAEARGGVDAAMAEDLGMSVADIANTFTAEQVDGYSLAANAHARDRGFLVSDATGAGKGRLLASIARNRLRRGGKVIYFTESAAINIPDVWRDMKAVGANAEASTYLLASGAKIIGPGGEEIAKAPSPAARKELMESGEWPEGKNLILTTYSQFSKKADSPFFTWLTQAQDEDVTIIMDEAHNALNAVSNTGRAIRGALEAVGKKNCVFGTATPLRDPTGVDLYAPLLPDEVDAKAIFEQVKTGNEVAQETFTTMLAEDGVMVRRDHDLSTIEFNVRFPDDEKVARNREYMDILSPIVEEMLNLSLRISTLNEGVAARQYRDLIARGVREETARARVNATTQYSLGFGSPLLNLTRSYMNAIKVDQVVQEAVAEIAEGRKPLITFHSTNAEVLKDSLRNDDGEMLSDEELMALPHLTIKDQLRRIHNGMYRHRINGEMSDARQTWPEIGEAFDRIDQLIERIPDILSVSPVDAVIEGIEANGYSVGELSGRTLAYRDGAIVKRADTNRKASIDAFNHGELDVLIYNAAGATGGSYHAAPEFKDQRPRTMIEMETPPDIIKYVQGQGRGNRYGQVAKPRVVSVVTGLTPEMRLLAQRNRKLRMLGASVDGNRAHPLLLDNIPDLINRVGDKAAERVLKADPVLARRMGFSDIVENGVEADLGNADVGNTSSDIESLANRTMARSILLSPDGQADFFERLRLEFEAIVEELDSRNANPLKPKMLMGEIEPIATTLFQGVERDPDDLDVSAFSQPLYMVTAQHHFTGKAITGEDVVSMVERSVIEAGSDGFQPYADILEQRRPGYMQIFLRDGVTYEQVQENPELETAPFKAAKKSLDQLVWLLENVRPGIQVSFPDDGWDSLQPRTIVKLQAPGRQHLHMPSGYKIHLVAPGDAEASIVSLARLVGLNQENIRFRPGFSLGASEQEMLRFDEDGVVHRQMPVQILTGNNLSAISTSDRIRLGSMSLYHTMDGEVMRGVVIPSHKFDVTMLPVHIPDVTTAVNLLVTRQAEGVGIWDMGSDRLDVDLALGAKPGEITIVACPYNNSHGDFWKGKNDLYRLITDDDIPAAPIRGISRKLRKKIPITEEGLDELVRALQRSGLRFMSDCLTRDIVNQLQGRPLIRPEGVVVTVDVEQVEGAHAEPPASRLPAAQAAAARAAQPTLARAVEQEPVQEPVRENPVVQDDDDPQPQPVALDDGLDGPWDGF